MEEKTPVMDLNLDTDSFETPVVPVESQSIETVRKPIKATKENEPKALVSCLRNERIIVRHVPKLTGIWGNNPRHVLSGGMAESAVRIFVVPRLTSGMYVNVLTDSEKAFLEDIMGLEYNALSIYRKVDNFWDDSNDNGISRVRLTKGDNYFNLADPEDYIRYKILLANKDFIAPSLQVLQDSPKATYQFVIIAEGEETKSAKLHMSNTMKCYKEFGKIENDWDTLKLVVETIDGRPVSKNTSIEWLQTKANTLIQNDSKLFLSIVTDAYLPTKVLISRSLEAGNLHRRGSMYFTLDNIPLCENNEEPTLNTAARYLNMPKHQELKLSLEAKLK